MLIDTRAMIVKISQKEKRLAANNAWGPSMAMWAYLLHKGVTDMKPEQLNPFIDPGEINNNGQIKSSIGKKLPWMSRATAQGIVLAAERKLLSTQFWLQIAGIWIDILKTAE